MHIRTWCYAVLCLFLPQTVDPRGQVLLQDL